jgi:hypothetical protein
MGQVVGKHFYQREAHGCVAPRGHPESPIAGGIGERALDWVSASTDSGAWPLNSWAATSSIITASAGMCSARAEWMK